MGDGDGLKVEEELSAQEGSKGQGESENQKDEPMLQAVMGIEVILE